MVEEITTRSLPAPSRRLRTSIVVRPAVRDDVALRVEGDRPVGDAAWEARGLPERRDALEHEAGAHVEAADARGGDLAWRCSMLPSA
jgi:hypothetical protein